MSFACRQIVLEKFSSIFYIFAIKKRLSFIVISIAIEENELVSAGLWSIDYVTLRHNILLQTQSVILSFRARRLLKIGKDEDSKLDLFFLTINVSHNKETTKQ